MFSRSQILLFAAMCGLFFISAPHAWAGNAEFSDLLSILRDNGTITTADYNRLKAALLSKDEDKPQQETALKVNIKPKEDVEVLVSTEGGLKVETTDENFSFELGGRLMTDFALYNEDKGPLGDGSKFRRARIELEGTMYRDWGYAFEMDFADGSDIKDASIEYKGFDGMAISFGQDDEPFSLDELTSSKYTTFMEEALPNALAPGSNIGLVARSDAKNYSLALGLYGEDFNDDPDNEADEGWAVTGRATYAPFYEPTNVVHLGLAASYRDPRGSDVSFDADTESDVTGSKYVDTGDIPGVESISRYGLEAASVCGPFSLQGEYMLAEVERASGYEDLTFDGWYVNASMFLTGESRVYKPSKGSFSRVIPKGKYGAWEVAARCSSVDLTDKDVLGGGARNYTLGLNWYIKPNLRFMANYIWVDNDHNADGDDSDATNPLVGDDDPQILQGRVQIDF